LFLQNQIAYGKVSFHQWSAIVGTLIPITPAALTIKYKAQEHQLIPVAGICNVCTKIIICSTKTIGMIESNMPFAACVATLHLSEFQSSPHHCLVPFL
jgi:hypothetical protein